MNDWLEGEHRRLYGELDTLKAGHASGRDNAEWIAETQGKLDACTVLKATPITAARIDDAAAYIREKEARDVPKMYADNYHAGADSFFDVCRERLEGR